MEKGRLYCTLKDIGYLWEKKLGRVKAGTVAHRKVCHTGLETLCCPIPGDIGGKNKLEKALCCISGSVIWAYGNEE